MLPLMLTALIGQCRRFRGGNDLDRHRDRASIGHHRAVDLKVRHRRSHAAGRIGQVAVEELRAIELTWIARCG